MSTVHGSSSRCFGHLALRGFLLALALAVPAQEPFATFPPQPYGVRAIGVYDSHGTFVGRILPQKRYWVTLDRIPGFLQQALLAVEDARFYEHGGIDLRGIARAMMKDVMKGKLAEGGSTITQQLMKNKFLSGEVSLDRKLKEAQLAMDFEKKYSKQQILEMYFNEIYFGNGAMGLAQAASLYFNKSPEALTAAECVGLAGVPKNPGRYNPAGKPAEVAGRRDVVLKRMVDLNLISARQAQALRAHPAVVQPPPQAPHYLAQIRTQLIQRFGPDIIEQGGLDVTGALDLALQKQAEQVLGEGVRRISPEAQGALVCLDPVTGDVLAAVGGVGGNPNSLNRAFASKRQPGSAIKPMIYAAALEQGRTASSLWNDAPVAYRWGNGNVWKPLNYGREEVGDQTLREALASSSNVIAVKVLEAVGVPAFVTFAEKMGLTVRAQSGLSLALGTDEVTLKDLVQAYTPLAAAGVRAEARTFLRIYDRKARTSTENPSTLTPVLSPAVAFITTEMLKDVLTHGTAKGLKKFSQAHPAAGKTGTTDDYQDAWFVGYTPQVITGVWVGYDKPRPGGKGFTGGAVAAPIWERFMTKALAGKEEVSFVQPDSVVAVVIDPTTGFRAAPDCPTTLEEFFVAGTEPTEFCAPHGGEPSAP